MCKVEPVMQFKVQVYKVYPLIFQSALSLPTSKSALILSVESQLFQETVYKRNYWPIDYLQGFSFMCGCTKE